MADLAEDTAESRREGDACLEEICSVGLVSRSLSEWFISWKKRDLLIEMDESDSV